MFSHFKKILRTMFKLDADEHAALLSTAAAIEATGQSLFIKDAKELRIVYFTPGSEGIFSRPDNKILGLSAYDQHPPHVAKMMEEGDRNVLSEKHPLHDSEVVRFDATLKVHRTLRLRKRVLRINSKTPNYIMVITEDITHLKALAAEREIMFESSLDMTAITDNFGYLNSVNPACTTVLGYTPEEIRKIRLKDLIHPEDLKSSVEYARKIVDEGLHGFS